MKLKFKVFFLLAIFPAVFFALVKIPQYIPGNFCEKFSGLELFAEIVILIPFLFLILSLMYGIVSFKFKSLVKFSEPLLWSFFSFLLVFGVFRITDSVKFHNLNKASANALPIIEQLDKYKLIFGSYPETKKALLEFWNKNEMPTGLCGPKEFRYSKNSSSQTGGYEIFIDTPTGILNWDQFIYRPSKNYSDISSKKLMGDWVYFYE